MCQAYADFIGIFAMKKKIIFGCVCAISAATLFQRLLLRFGWTKFQFIYGFVVVAKNNNLHSDILNRVKWVIDYLEFSVLLTYRMQPFPSLFRFSHIYYRLTGSKTSTVKIEPLSMKCSWKSSFADVIIFHEFRVIEMNVSKTQFIQWRSISLDSIWSASNLEPLSLTHHNLLLLCSF